MTPSPRARLELTRAGRVRSRQDCKVVQPKPSHYSADYAAWFQDPLVIAAYPARPPYPEQVFELLASLVLDAPRAVVDVGCGPGDLARPLAPLVERVDAVDFAAGMLELGQSLPGGDASNVRWIHAGGRSVHRAAVRTGHRPREPALDGLGGRHAALRGGADARRFTRDRRAPVACTGSAPSGAVRDHCSAQPRARTIARRTWSSNWSAVGCSPWPGSARAGRSPGSRRLTSTSRRVTRSAVCPEPTWGRALSRLSTPKSGRCSMNPLRRRHRCLRRAPAVEHHGAGDVGATAAYDSQQHGAEARRLRADLGR